MRIVPLWLNLFLHGRSYKEGLCSRFMTTADELVHEAKALRSELEGFQHTPNPLAAMVATAHNNQEFERETARDRLLRRAV